MQKKWHWRQEIIKYKSFIKFGIKYFLKVVMKKGERTDPHKDFVDGRSDCEGS